MANQRGADQKAVIVMMSEEFVDLIDSSFPTLGFSDRSAFIREAVRVKLGAAPALAAAPSRAGKGGPKPTVLVREEIEPYRPKKTNTKK